MRVYGVVAVHGVMEAGSVILETIGLMSGNKGVEKKRSRNKLESNMEGGAERGEGVEGARGEGRSRLTFASSMPSFLLTSGPSAFPLMLNFVAQLDRALVFCSLLS